MDYINKEREKVVVALSGGVDSSVSAGLLVEEGYEVVGMFMKNWSPVDGQSLLDCPWRQDQEDAQAVCEKLGIQFRCVNFEKEYKEQVVNYFVNEYAKGRTPNPDVMCNREIKFKLFLEEAKKMGAKYIATGHYAQIKEENGVAGLYRGVDESKDQSYFLWGMSKEAVERSIFPVGKYTKVEVRDMAIKMGLPNSLKKDSQGICFIGHIDLKNFLMEYIQKNGGRTKILSSSKQENNKCDIAERINSAEEIGRHCGTMYYTIGERAGGIIDNRLYRKWAIKRGENTDVPNLYVIGKDLSKNIIYITNNREDLLFYTKEVLLEGFYFTGNEDKSDVLGLNNLNNVTCQVRYQQKHKVEVESIKIDGGNIVVCTKEPSRAIAAGQSMVFYQGERVIGAGIIGREVIN